MKPLQSHFTFGRKFPPSGQTAARNPRRMCGLGCYRPGPLWLWKALLVFVAIAFAGQLMGLIFNKSGAQPATRLLFYASDVQGPPLGSCRPHTRLMFLKTHKTASSTVLNMLYRFGEERGLRFALPMGYQLGYPLLFNAHRVKGYQGPRVLDFDIMGNHMRFNKPEVEKVMPEDTFYFSIVRDPVALTESSFAYYKEVAPAFRKAKSLGDFADNPRQHYDPRLRNNHYARNLLWFDFGMDHNANFSEGLALRGEALVRRAFRLILVSEYYDQSMVLLRHALCWPLDAVVSFSLNARQQKPPGGAGGGGESWMDKAAAAAVAAAVGVRGGRPPMRAPPDLSLTPAQREKLREWNALDWHLYQAFNRSFWEDVRRFGPERMDQEVALLRARRDQLARVCLRNGGRPVEAQRIRDKGIRPFQSGVVKILGYELQPGLDNGTTEACLRLIRPEIQYKDVLDAKQFPRPQFVKGPPGQRPRGPAMAVGGGYVGGRPLWNRERLPQGAGEGAGPRGGWTMAAAEREWLARQNQTSLLRADAKGRLR
ncbi:galactose-3-O-sulfotransferase 4 isoform X1 [Gadus macrocephalus]|uniref:galactose-3-O-sulfotransferase 4 isoform X1 n=1 Tax=Gadus macrocephalus TaxID=80720 RepID=UPI0028CB6A81|nr:galactose-3-O-sulfotransferase 4 isoform X1 [Gadus macrocephalus]XP_059932747.1 galactose-3-O-sulfotransferase 4 isoform X1 [Gadus macrocephalus]